MKVCVVGNLSDTACGFQSVADQTVTALRRAGLDVLPWDGTYSALYARREAGEPTFFPPDIETCDIVHCIWNAATMNHYSGADWASLRRPVTSWLDGGPTDATCPFEQWMQVRWSDYPRAGYHTWWYPVPDWVEDLPAPDPGFTVGWSSVRGAGVPVIEAIGAAHGWPINRPTPGVWLSVEDEVRRLARSTVNVGWYATQPSYKNRASAPAMLLAAGRPVVLNRDALFAEFADAEDLYHGETVTDAREPLEAILEGLAAQDAAGIPLRRPSASRRRWSWTAATDLMQRVWAAALEARR